MTLEQFKQRYDHPNGDTLWKKDREKVGAFFNTLYDMARNKVSTYVPMFISGYNGIYESNP